MADNKFINDLAAITQSVTSPNAAASMNLARDRGNDIATQNQILTDRSTLSPIDFMGKYGADVSSKLDTLGVAAQGLDRFMDTDRSVLTQIDDIDKSVGVGFLNSVGGVATLGARLAGRDAAQAVSGLVDRTVKGIQADQSPEMRSQREISALTSQLDKNDNDTKYKADLQKEGKLTAELRSFGRSASDAAYRLYENPTVLESGLSEGVGSVLAAAPVGGVVGAFANIGRSVVARGAAGATLNQASNIPLAIGLMEGGSSYSGSVNEVLGMSHEDLLKNSQSYRELIDAGIAQDEAKRLVADDAGLRSAAIQGPIAAATGKLVSAFEGAPLAVQSLRHAATNVGREGLEEGIQSFTGGAAQNYAIQQTADNTRRVGDDLGGQTAEGAILGLGAAGGLQAPGLGARAISMPVKGLINGARDIGNFVSERGEQFRARQEQDVLDNVQADVTQATADAPTVMAGIQELAQENNQADDEASIRFINRASALPSIQPADLRRLAPEQQRALFEMAQEQGGRPDRFMAINAMSKMIQDDTVSDADKASAALFIADQYREVEDLINSVPDYLLEKSQDDPRLEAFDEYGKKFTQILSIPAVAQAVIAARSPTLISEDIIDDNTARNLAGQAEHNPENVNPEFAAKVLLQTDKGSVTLDPAERAKIEAAVAVKRAAQTYAEQPEVTESASEIVSKQIATDGGDKAWQLSMADRLKQFQKARSLGDMAGAERSIIALNMFAKSLANKVDALNQSAAQNRNGLGPKIKYESSSQNNRWIPVAQQYTAALHTQREGSVKNARRIHADATALAMFANNMATIYPEYNLPQIEVAPLALDQKTVPAKQEARQEAVEPKKVETPVETKEASPEAPVVETSTEQVTDQVVQDELNERPGKAERRQAEREAQVIADEKVEQVGKAERRAAEREARNEANQTVDKEVAETLETRYPNLLSIGEGTGENQFYKAYRLPKKEKSRLTRLTNPITDLFNLFKTPRLLVDFIKREDGSVPITYDFTRNELDKLSRVMKLSASIIGTMNDQFTSADTKALMKAVENGSDANRYVNGRNLNITERGPDGKIRYNKQLLQSAVLAGISHALNANTQKIQMTSQDVAEVTGMPIDQITEVMVDQFNRGMTLDDFKRGLADKIIDYWGVERNSKTENTQVIGIAEGVAAEVIQGMDEAGLISVGYTTRGKNKEIVAVNDPIVMQWDVNGEEKTFTQNRVHFDVRDEELANDIVDMGAANRLLDSVALVEGSKALGSHIGKPSGNIPQKQLRSQVDNAPQQREAIAAAASQAYMPNLKMHGFMEVMQYEFFQKFMGGYAYKEGELHPQHERSVKGKNLTLRMSYDSAMRHMKELGSYVKEFGELKNVPTFFDFNMSKVGRLQMQGGNTPQSDKLWRELFMPTRSVLDMTNEAHEDAFWLTVAQGLGLKTEKEYRAKSVADAKALANNEYNDIIEDMVKWVDKGTALPTDLGDRIIAAMGKGRTMHGLHSLMSVAALRNAERTGADMKAFEHFNYLEADGKTNGPIMTVALFASQINADIIKVLRKGGIYLGELGKSLNSYIQDGQDTDKGDDLYQSGTKAFARFQDNFRDKHKNNSMVMEKLNKLQKIMSYLDSNIELGNDGTLVMNRGVIKNPMTISIYGSGIDGIAGKVTDGLMEKIYELSSQSRNGNKPSLDDLTYKGFVADLESLGSEMLATVDDEVITAPAYGNPKGINGAISARTYNALKSHVRVLFVEQMHKGINDQILRHVERSTNALQIATQLQSIFLSGAYRKGVVLKMLDKQKSPNYRKGDWLSRADEDAVLKSLEKFSPIIKTGTQNFFIAGSEKANLVPSIKMEDGTTINVPESYAAAMNGRLRSSVYGFGPSPAGVKGVPSLVIGTGDGMIMQNALAALGIEDALPVFDGINFRADKIDENSRKVNEAVWMAMSANPMEHIADSFNTLLANNPVNDIMNNDGMTDINDFIIEEISKTFYGKFKVEPSELLTKEQVQAYLETIAKDLNDLSLETKARNIVLGEWGMSVDQMASGESPFSKEGFTPESNDAQEIADLFNARYQQVLKSLRDGEGTPPAVEQSNNEVMTSLMDTTTSDESGARIATIPSLQVWLENAAKDLSTDQKTMMSSALQNLKDSGYRILFGSSDQLSQYEAVNYPDYYTPVDYLGKVIPETRHIYITNITGETILHELVHAATLDKVVGYYSNNVALSDSDRDAVRRIEGLMGEWLTQSTVADSQQLNLARMTATNQVSDAINKGQMAIAVNEFMAWALSNQELIKGAKKVAVKNPLFRVLGETLEKIKALIWGKRTPKVADDIYSNLRFNTRILMKTPTPTELLRSDVRKSALFQSPSFGSSQRLTDLRNRLATSMTAYLTAPYEGPTERNQTPTRIKEIAKEAAAHKQNRAADLARAQQQASDVMTARVSAIFKMTPQAQSTFESVYAVMVSSMELDPNSLSRIQDMYEHVLKKLTVEDLMTDPLSTNPGDRYLAQQKFDVLSGAYAAKIDRQGRSDRVPTFMALAMVDDGFRQYLSKLDLPKSEKDLSGTLDAVLDNRANQAMDALASAVAGDYSATNVQQAMDKLSMKFAEISASDNRFMEQYLSNGADRADAFIRDNRNKLADKLFVGTDKVVKNATNPAVRGVARFLRFGATLLNDQRAGGLVQEWSASLNSPDANTTFRELLSEVVGRPSDFGGVFDMINPVRAAVQQVREGIRNKLPQQISSKFSRDLTDFEKTSMFHVMAKTDAAALFERFGINGTLEMLSDDARLDTQIATLEGSIASLAPTRVATILKKSKQLAHFMKYNAAGDNLLRNAHAIAHLFGEVGQARKVDPELVKQIDALVSMYAVKDADRHLKASVKKLIQDENAGMAYALSQLVGTRDAEYNNITTDVSRINGYKGFIPSINMGSGNLIVDNVGDEAKYRMLGYQPMAGYQGSSADRGMWPKQYYYNPMVNRPTYNQGVLQTVHQTVNGIQPSTGFSVGSIAGRITDPTRVAQITRIIRSQRPTQEPLLPIYGKDGKVVAYERSLSPNMQAMIDRSTDMPDMLGVWRGRQFEEKLAQTYNDILIDRVYDQWQEAKKSGTTDQYVDLSTSQDKIHIDSWNLVPENVRDNIKAKFGKDGFPVRRDMVNDVIGARSASVGDVWTGNTRLSDKRAKQIQNIALGIFDIAGDFNPKLRGNAYSILTQAEKTLQSVITELKVMIVVKSVIVPVANAVSNVYQLMHRGVPLIAIAKGMTTKAAETNDYIKRKAKEVSLDADLMAARGVNDTVAIRKITNQIEAIKDSYKRMSIWPLIEAGEFTAITEGGVSSDDLKLSNWIEKGTKHIPAGLQSTYRYAMLTKDTSLFQGMARAVQYSDFLAKAVMYDDLTKRQRMKSEEALIKVSEEFVNYNRYAGRVRSYAESTGLIWFWNFKLRSIKIANSMIRDNPARSLLMAFFPPVVPLVGNIGDPISDNMVSVIMDGKLGNSIGLSTGLRAPTLLPWVQLMR